MKGQKEHSNVQRVELPFMQAVNFSARQNFNRDVREGKHKKTDWSRCKNDYLSEARAFILRDGKNKPPVYPDTKHYVFKSP